MEGNEQENQDAKRFIAARSSKDTQELYEGLLKQSLAKQVG